MIKKITLALLPLGLLVGCQTPLEQKYPEAKYKISDQSMKKIVATMNTLEQCFHPELKNMSVSEAYKKVYDKYSEIDEIVWNELVFAKVIKNTIGLENFVLLHQDKASLKLFEAKQERLNNQQETVNDVECDVFKASFNRAKVLVKSELENQRLKQK